MKIIASFVSALILSALFALTLYNPPANADSKPIRVVIDQCDNNLVVLDEKSGSGFTTSIIKFCDQHTAEEFADAVNAVPISFNRQAKLKVQRHATVYAK